jgi:Cysteine synthase
MFYDYGEPLIKLQSKDVSIAIGNTPVLRLEINGVEFLAKAEWFNMFTIDGTVHGSVKMRPAYYMIKSYIKEHDWREKTIIEPTSGNTGIALAALSKVYSFRFVPVISSKATHEVKEILEKLGISPLVVDEATSPLSGGTYTDQAIAYVMKMMSRADFAEKHVWLNQFDNDANPRAHQETTSKEIIRLSGIDTVVTGIGTGGSFAGLRRGLNGSGIRLVGVQPKNGQKIQGLRNISDSSFIPPIILREVLNNGVIEDVDLRNSIWIIEKILDKYGILPGLSSGATAYCAYEMAKRGKRPLAIFADTGQNYVCFYETLGISLKDFNFRKLYDPGFLPLL